jgi:Na+-driven multidrug efflux pump
VIAGYSISVWADRRAAFSAILVVLRHQIAYLFTSDPVVVAGVAQLTIYVALFQVSSSLSQLDTNLF